MAELARCPVKQRWYRPNLGAEISALSRATLDSFGDTSTTQVTKGRT